MAVAIGKKKFRSFLQPVSTSSSFQEALRLCRQGSGRTRSSSAEEDVENSEDTKGSNSSSSTSHQQDDLEEMPLSSAGSDPESIGTSSSRRTLRRNSDPVSSVGTRLNFRLRSVDRRMGEQLHVQWAEDLVREHPRKRYERKPSLPCTDSPRSILKH